MSERYPYLGQDKVFGCFDMTVAYTARACPLRLSYHALLVT